ncbi:MAG: hypothetical protein LBH00_02755 [Planctomycetaceae bacterium]|nr:hypothetical protein [Planctomycetaceae bacterium]
MEWTHAHYEQIKHLLPKQRGNVKIDNTIFFEAMIHITENGFCGVPCRKNTASGTASIGVSAAGRTTEFSTGLKNIFSRKPFLKKKLCL